MKKSCYRENVKGFTLIELLVVVLIIGILASIALPQYQKAVERARMTEAIQALDPIANAQNILYMQTGRFAIDLEDLNTNGDITVPGAREGTWGTLTTSVTGNSGEGRMMPYGRRGGQYQGGTLRVSIFPDGSIQKTCNNPVGTTEFCLMAENAGYTCAEATGTSCPS